MELCHLCWLEALWNKLQSILAPVLLASGDTHNVNGHPGIASSAVASRQQRVLPTLHGLGQPALGHLHWSAQAQRLAHHHVHVLQTPQVLPGGWPGQITLEDLAQLCKELLLHPSTSGDVVQAPRQQQCRGLVPRNQHGQQLVSKLALGEASRGQRALGCAEVVEQTVGRASVLSFPHRFDDLVQHAVQLRQLTLKPSLPRAQNIECAVQARIDACFDHFIEKR
mmetsp:Transcript_1873/g.4407  ORF Transcript_1873/g.4407 Transcript_1873/m.4407 type:complete len:224 (+) Transcript_1873:2282-2953(+)